ncbi:hypothetical protein CVT24_010439 [Panaeolus cyanescens]|uniref:Uncharacterized protein n=1 Tax=Panaeolus cyanescens TaxID=181874 RepID=A0A409YPQ3_9AGAR|nr:hypothetical protein CVT24_010439 [Panaeolus cyanescens]
MVHSSALDSFDPFAVHPFTNGSGVIPQPPPPSRYPAPIPAFHSKPYYMTNQPAYPDLSTSASSSNLSTSPTSSTSSSVPNSPPQMFSSTPSTSRSFNPKDGTSPSALMKKDSTPRSSDATHRLK